jgi:hypothetical protein
MGSRVRPAALLCAALAAALLVPAPAVRAGDDKKAAAEEKTFVEAWAAAGADEKLRAKAVEDLSKASDGTKVSLLTGRVLPKEESPSVQAAAVAVLRKVRDEAALKALVDLADGKGNWEVRGPVIEGLAASSSAPVVACLRALLKSSESKTVAAALFALAENHPKEALEDVRKVMEHASWQVRLGTLDYLGRLGDRSVLPMLVIRLEEETGRLRQEVVEALKSISGVDYGRNAEKWRAYVAGGEAAAKAAGEKPADPAAPGGGRAVATGDPPVEPTYYGQKIYSDRVVFVVDLSLSMLEEMVVDRDMIIRETGAVVSSGHEDGKGGASPPPKREDEIIPIEWWKIRTRFDFARSQLKYVISTLKRDQRFDIVWFSDSVKTWQGGLCPAIPAMKFKAVEWLDSLKCEGGTNSWGGLMKALNLVGRGTEGENITRGADTLYFMSDGEPSCGDIKDKDQIIAAMERIHKVRRVKVNVVQIGTSPLPFMKRLAAVTDGEYKFFNAKGPAK